MSTPQQINLEQFKVRVYEPSDHDAVNRLYRDGMLSGEIQPNDTGADIENIDDAYILPKRSCFWVGEYEQQVIAMIGVAEDEPDIAEIRRLRVQPEIAEPVSIARRLVETAIGFCRHHGYLKVILDTRITHSVAIEVFDKFAFHHTRTKVIHGKDVLEFYLDLYREVDEADTSGIF